MKTKQVFLSIVILLLGFTPAFGSETGLSVMEETMYSSGKIYVVVAVVAVLLIGILAYLFYLDRRLNRMEKMQNKKP